LRAFFPESPYRCAAACAGRELGGEDLVVLRLAKRPDDESGEGRGWGLRFSQFHVGDGARLEKEEGENKI